MMSRYPWLANLPDHWDVANLSHVATVETGSADVQDSSDEGKFPFFVRSDQILRLNFYTHNTEAVLTAGDGRVGEIFHHISGKFAAHQRVYVIQPGQLLDGRFLLYTMKAHFGSSLGGTTAKSTVESLRRPMLTSFKLAFPSLPEQRKIADYLDRETAEIDAFIADQEHFHKLLLEHQEATRSNVIRRVAEQHRAPHVRLKFLANVTVGIVVNPSSWYVEVEGVPALRGLNVRPEEISTSELVHISREGHAVHSKSRLEAGDLVVVRTGQAGAAAVIPQDFHDCNAIDLLIVKPGPTVASEFLAMYINSDVARGVIAAQSVGAIQAHFNVEALRNLPIPLLDVSQQLHLVGVWQKESRAVELSLRDVEISIHLAKERRSALISAAVTGKIDVTTQGAPTAEQLRDELEVHV